MTICIFPIDEEGLHLVRKSVLIFAILFSCSTMLSSCALLRQPLDRWSGFSKYLKETEHYVMTAQWRKAATSLRKANRAWFRVRPWLQVDIDHDYINTIEANFIRLQSYIATSQRSDSLTTIRLLQNDWKNIGEM
jgi:hypothetical protein